MPPSSRKRNKGKERKAKREADKAEAIRANAHQLWWRFCSSISYPQCDHGCDVAISDDHPISSFIDQFYINLRHKRMTASEGLTNLFETHRQIWNNNSYTKLAIDTLIRIGTNMMVIDDIDISWLLCLAQTIVILELDYNDTNDIDLILNNPTSISKRINLVTTSSSKRDVLKFFRKQVSCKCLKKMHLEARKTSPKKGLCWNCNVETKRVSLSVCSRCMVQQYCSRECQVADWEGHKEECNFYVKGKGKKEEGEDEGKIGIEAEDK